MCNNTENHLIGWAICAYKIHKMTKKEEEKIYDFIEQYKKQEDMYKVMSIIKQWEDWQKNGFQKHKHFTRSI